ncbi:unnamed protein product [Lactuca saligna]|uniref:Uncharacterized protein n=1 Tax=Lactuca saligna TaxID=75948 RepID=A0AA35ZMF5_LACSI|nr:unnamed protein product [Lactuca saligna]
MASLVPVDDNSNTKSEEGTMAFHKKRARRVSFAENTSVHIFDRDEDSGTPLEPKPPSSPSDELGSGELNHERGQLFWNVDEDDNDNNNEDDDMDEPGSRSPFLRFIGSPSSGGSTVGSANSNDEDNFFGPVSANFIRRDLLDSSASDANHDQTMDSTAFSMHFRSIARSDSEVELKTSTGVHLSFDEKTPTHDSVPNNTGNSMLMTLAKKPDYRPSLSTSKLSTASESNDMSIVGEYHYKYDYGELSPTLDALMADPSGVSILKSPRNVEATMENGDNLMDLSCNEDNDLQGISGHELVNVDAFQIKSNLGFSTIGQSNPSPKTTIYINDVIGKEHKSPFIDGVIPSKSPMYVTPSHNRSSVFVRTEDEEHVLSIQSMQKSISKLKMLKASPFSAALSAKLEDSIIKSVTRPSKMTPLNTLLEKNDKSPLLNSVKDSGHLSSDVQKKRARESSTNMNDIRFETPNNIVPVTRLQKIVEIASPLLIPHETTHSKHTTVLPQSLDFSSQKRLKVVNTTGFRSSPLRIEKSGSLVSSTQDEMVDIREVSLHEVCCDSKTKDNPTILLKNEEHEKFEDKFMGSDIVLEEMKGASPVFDEGTDKQSWKKNLHYQFCESPSNKQPCNNNSLQDEDMMIEITATTHTSPKAHVHPEISKENEISTLVQKLNHPNEIKTMVSNEVEKLLSHSVDKFNLRVIDRLSDIVDQLLMSKTYQLLSDEIQSQKSVDISKKSQHKRASEIKLLLCKFVHEKAKLQLMQVKQEMLLKRVKSLASGISESEELKSNFPPSESMSVNMNGIQESQIESDKVSSTRLDLNNIDQKIESLTKSFHKSCKMKEELSSLDTITFVNNHLRKQACCQIIRKDMQLWVVDNLKNRNGCHSVDLNYLDLMTQRLSLNADRVPSVSISYELNDVNISKIFKDMEACTAFRFVFTQKHVDGSNLAKETQVTGALFGNLLDVMEEIQHSRIELKNLISTRFRTPLADQLDLDLCFFDPKHRRKATVTLNFSCLKRGIYPSEIIPYQIHIPANQQSKSSPTLADEITTTLKNLKTGFLRIQRVCTCISNKLVGSGGKEGRKTPDGDKGEQESNLMFHFQVRKKLDILHNKTVKNIHNQRLPHNTAAENKEEDEKGPILIRVFKSYNRNTSALLQCNWVYNLVA